ncbi:MAG: rod shape-determining protein MreD [Hydrogenophilales bacterium 32-62-9]|nr:MAG: rod shape-determining protein MreD [Hydrogenophilales bacterium 32-62-9]
MSATPSNGSWRRILGSLTLALLLEQLPWSGWALALRPDFLLIGVLFWTLHQPARISFGAAFLAGLLADFQNGGVFGQHAMAYVVGVYLLLFFRLRLLQFDPLRQAAQLLPMFLLVQLLLLLIGWLAGNPPSDWSVMLPVASNTLMWLMLVGVLRLWHGKGMQDRA